jgi:hypothetical protein
MRAFLICLDGEPESRVPASHIAREQPVDQHQRQLEPLSFLGVQRHADSGVAGLAHELLDHRIELAHDSRRAREFVARMQCREFDRDAVPRRDGLARLDGAADRRNGGGVFLAVPLGIRARERGLA